VKLWPQSSQNWPVRAAPHRGHVSPEPDSPPLSAMVTPSPAGPGGAETPGPASTELRVGAPIRMPHTSQKSSLTDSWPDGQVAIATPS
jgi:hypothetical protein